MTDSETLRAMLKERGIKYETRDALGACETSWCGYTAYQLTPESKLIMHPTPEQAIAATVGERNPDGLPIGLTVSNDGNLLNWMGENYVRQDAATVDEESEMYICKRCGVAYELNILDKGFGKPRFCPNCGYREMYQ